MSPMQGTLLTTADIARIRGAMTPAELLQRATRAAALELRGKSYSEARADVAAELVARALERTAGTLPNRNDPQHSLTVYCGRARNLRASIDAERKRDNLAADMAADADALSMDALAPSERTDAEADRLANLPTPSETFARSVQACARIGRGTDAATVDLIYRSAREAHGLKGAAIRAELTELRGTEAAPTVQALDVRCSRARKALAADSDAHSLLARLTASMPTPTLRYLAADLSRAAVHHGQTWTGKALRDRAAEWRTRPIEPAPVTTRRVRKRTAKLATRATADLVDARSRLLAAERAESRR